MPPSTRLIDSLAALEAEHRLGRYSRDPGRQELADCLRDVRQRLELRLENELEGREPDTRTGELFPELVR